MAVVTLIAGADRPIPLGRPPEIVYFRAGEPVTVPDEEIPRFAADPAFAVDADTKGKRGKESTREEDV